MISGPIDIALKMASALEACGVPYLLGGSLASSIAGEPRSTIDIDMVVALPSSEIDRFVVALGSEFYVDAGSIRRAVLEAASFNAIHLPTSTKVDLFILGGTPFDHGQMSRRVRVVVARAPDRFLYVYTPEDILLQKLRWYRLGEETSDRQWRDIVGIVRVQGSALDEAYLQRGAGILGVVDLMERALLVRG